MVTSPPSSTSHARQSHTTRPREEGHFQDTCCYVYVMEQVRAQVEHHLTIGGLDLGWTMNQPLFKFLPRAGSNPLLLSTLLWACKPEPRMLVPVEVESSDNEPLCAGDSKRSRSERLLIPAYSEPCCYVPGSKFGIEEERKEELIRAPPHRWCVVAVWERGGL